MGNYSSLVWNLDVLSRGNSAKVWLFSQTSGRRDFTSLAGADFPHTRTAVLCVALRDDTKNGLSL